MDADYFLYWVKTYLYPILGSYELGEVWSVLLMDNASTHMLNEVEAVIAETGAILAYRAPYYPHLNPIQYFFS